MVTLPRNVSNPNKSPLSFKEDIMSRKRRKSTKTSRKAGFGKVGNWGESSWKDTSIPTTNRRNDKDNKHLAKAFK
mgnify:CR=1 FL=1